MNEVTIDAPALVYLKDVKAWLAVNNWGEPISWTDEPGEIAWFLIWIQTPKDQMRQANDNPASNARIGSPTRRGKAIAPERDNSITYPGKIAAHGAKR